MPGDESLSGSNLDHTPERSQSIVWLDIFYGMLISPIATLRIIGNPSAYMPHLAALLGTALIVIIAVGAESAVGADSLSIGALGLAAIGSIFSGLFFWLILTTFVRLLAALMGKEVSIRSCFIVTGWAFLPLLFKAPAACFSNVTIFGDVLSLIISGWFLILELFAFDSVLGLGRFKTLAFVLFLPVGLFFTYLLSVVFASIFVLDCLF